MTCWPNGSALPAALQLLRRRTLQQLVDVKVVALGDHLDQVRLALLAHAEELGAYHGCSFAAPGEGTFTPLDGAHPYIGSVGRQERVREQRLELLIDRANVAR